MRSAYLGEAHFLLLVYKESFLNTNDKYLSFPSVVGSLLQEFGDVFPEEFTLACHPLEGLSIELISFLEQQFLIGQHIEAIQKKRRSFKSKWKISWQRDM